MKPEYLRKIESLQREVDFHPVLRALLPRLPTVTHVEYKRTIRKGADFVIIKRDEVLDEKPILVLFVKLER